MTPPILKTRPARRGLWFPLALAALLLLTLPAAALLGLSLLGYEGDVNGRLQRRFSLSYHSPLPPWASVVLLLVPPLLVLLYFLKLRRAPLQVPSTFLWKKSIEDLHVNSLFQWLRDNVLLLAQLLVVLLLIYSLLGVQLHGSTGSGKHYILLIDSSASMSATDVAPSRLEAARAEALKEIDARAEGDTGMVIEFNSRAAILQPYTRDRGLLRAAVQRIAPTQRPTRIDEALALAESLANPQKSSLNAAVTPENQDPSKARAYVEVQLEAVAAEVHLYSDGRFPDVPGFAAGNLSLDYHRVGKPGAENVENVGLADFNAVRDEKDPSKLQVFVRVVNYRPARTPVTVELEWRVRGAGDFRLRDQAADLPARVLRGGNPDRGELPRDEPGEVGLTFDLDDVEDSSELVLRARLKGWKDAFALDDEAWLVAGVARKARVLVVTPGNDVLTHFFGLEETARVANVAWLAPADLAREEKYGRPTRAGEYDLVVFDRCAPADEDHLPLANSFYISDVPPPWKRADLKPLEQVIERPIIRNPVSNHPLMRHLTGLDEIAFSEAFHFPLDDRRVPPRTPRLLEGDRGTGLMFVLQRRTFQDLVLTFPLVNDRGQWATSWNLKLSFPVFLRNVLYGLGNVTDAAAEEGTRPGAPRVIRPEKAVERVDVTDPAGNRRTLKRAAGMEFVYQDAERVGVYAAAWAGGQRSFAVNLLDGEESNLQPRDGVRLGAQTIPAGQTRRQMYDTWTWVALAAVLLLVLEWAVYHRRIFA